MSGPKPQRAPDGDARAAPRQRGQQRAEIAKRIDIAATAIFHGMTVDGLSDLDLSYTPPLGSPWDGSKWAPRPGFVKPSRTNVSR